MSDEAASVYLEILDRLHTTNAFTLVEFGSPSEPLTSQDYPLCWLRPQTWESLDETDPILVQKVERFIVEIRVKREEGQGGLTTFAKLTKLAAAVQAAIDLQPIPGTILGLTRLKSGKYSEQYPTTAVELTGEFSYLIKPASTT
jgi:hypothetical protein